MVKECRLLSIRTMRMARNRCQGVPGEEGIDFLAVGCNDDTDSVWLSNVGKNDPHIVNV